MDGRRADTANTTGVVSVVIIPAAGAVVPAMGLSILARQ